MLFALQKRVEQTCSQLMKGNIAFISSIKENLPDWPMMRTTLTTIYSDEEDILDVQLRKS